MKYCVNKKCDHLLGYFDREGDYCMSCGGELLPQIHCQCGKFQINPRLHQAFCPQCGRALTEDYLGECIALQFEAMVRELAKQKTMDTSSLTN